MNLAFLSLILIFRIRNLISMTVVRITPDLFNIEQNFGFFHSLKFEVACWFGPVHQSKTFSNNKWLKKRWSGDRDFNRHISIKMSGQVVFCPMELLWQNQTPTVTFA